MKNLILGIVQSVLGLGAIGFGLLLITIMLMGGSVDWFAYTVIGLASVVLGTQSLYNGLQIICEDLLNRWSRSVKNEGRNVEYHNE